MCYRELKKIISDRGISNDKLAHLLGIGTDELISKLSGKTEFTLWEIKQIAEIFSLKNRQIMHIFFSKKFPKGNKLGAG
jgi:predicted transcriptional regulator